MTEFCINDRWIGTNHEPFIIAEMSGNHNQSLEKALSIVDAAAECGVDALKVQTYTADTITINMTGGLFSINDEKSLWSGNNLYSLYQKAYTPWEWHEKIFERAHEKGLICFSTPFDESAVDFLEDLGAPIYKVASFENSYLPLLRKIASTGKPVIMSTGMADLGELSESVNELRAYGCKDLTLLKCTSSYPAEPIDSNIRTIPHLAETFDCIGGLSDHTLGIGVAVAAIALGARVIEKHFVLDRSEGGVDAAFSMEPDQMKALVEESKRAFKGLGKVHFGISEGEKDSIRYRRSIYVVSDIDAGDTFNKENVRIIRPGDGIHPRYLDIILGKKTAKQIKRGTPLTWDVIL